MTGLLQILLDFADRSRSAAAGVVAELAPGPSLSQQVPALVQLLLGAPELLVLLLRCQLTSCQPGPQVVLGLDEVVDGTENFLVIHSLVLPRGSAHPATLPAQRHGSVLPRRYVPAMQLSRKRIIATAIGLIDADGAEAVSMQRLATELGCSLIALYDHVPSRGALLDAVADEVMSGIAWTDPPHTSFQDQVRALAQATRDVATEHPRCAMLALSGRVVPASLVLLARRALATLREAGFSTPDSVRIVRVLAFYFLGLLAWEAGIASGLRSGDDGPPRRPHPAGLGEPAGLHSELRASDIAGDLELGAELLAHAMTGRVS